MLKQLTCNVQRLTMDIAFKHANENNTITISSETALKDLKLIIAIYDNEGRLTNCEIKTVTTTAGENYQETITEECNMKIMLWNGLDTMYPIGSK